MEKQLKELCRGMATIAYRSGSAYLPASRARLRKVGPSTVLCSAAKGGCKINKFKVDSFDSRDEHNWRKLPVSCGGGVAKACE